MLSVSKGGCYVDLKSLLNKEQYEGAVTIDGPVLILAGAGSGKTRVLTYRMAHMIDDLGVMPYKILAITFTNKAAKEMQERVKFYITHACERPCNTSFCKGLKKLVISILLLFVFVFL